MDHRNTENFVLRNSLVRIEAFSRSYAEFNSTILYSPHTLLELTHIRSISIRSKVIEMFSLQYVRAVCDERKRIGNQWVNEITA